MYVYSADKWQANKIISKILINILFNITTYHKILNKIPKTTKSKNYLYSLNLNLTYNF